MGHYFLDTQYDKNSTDPLLWLFKLSFKKKSFLPFMILRFDRFVLNKNKSKKSHDPEPFLLYRGNTAKKIEEQGTICQGSSDPFYIVSYYIKWVTTSWTHSTLSLLVKEKKKNISFSRQLWFICNNFSLRA